MQHSIRGRGMAAPGNEQHWRFCGPAAIGGVEEHRPVASRDAQLEGRTCSQPLH